MSAKPILWIVIPCYNEEAVLPLTAPMFLEKLEQLETEISFRILVFRRKP